jgi:hypothetical protein
MRRLLLPLAALPLAACAESPEELADRVADRSGVVRVSAVEEDIADGDIPFHTVPTNIVVTMEGDATRAEVMAVFDAYDDAIEDGDVLMLEVTLEGPKHATLSSGEGVHVTRGAVADLVAAQADPSVVGYRREEYPDEPPHVEVTRTEQ